jgi:selenide,water dikinase
MAQIPLLPNVQQLAESGYITGASGRNWDGYGHDVVLANDITPVQQMLLTDPQTSGGLLVSCAAESVDEVLALFRREGFAHAAVIGEMAAGSARVDVSA